jgi:hypothetical protein
MTNSKIHLITVATHADGYFKWLQESCKRYNTELTVLGWSEKWKGYAWKFMLMIDHLNTVADDDIVCFIDAFDVILLRPLDEMIDYYRAIATMTNKRIVIACDRVKYQALKVMADYIFDTCKDIAINTGTYIGYAKDVKNVLRQIMNNNMDETLDDQKLLTDYCIINPDIFYIDQDSIFFLTIEHPLNNILDEHIKISDHKLYYMGTRPFFIHANGNGKLDDTIKLLGYEMSNEEIEKIDEANYRAIQRKIIYYSKFFIEPMMTILILYVLYVCIKSYLCQ